MKTISINTNTLYKAFLLCGLLTSALAQAETKVNVIKLESVIRGNQEQPKVLTIVPWQTPKTKAIFANLQRGLIDSEFPLLERNAFIREVGFHQKLLKQVGQFDPAYRTPEQ